MSAFSTNASLAAASGYSGKQYLPCDIRGLKWTPCRSLGGRPHSRPRNNSSEILNESVAVFVSVVFGSHQCVLFRGPLPWRRLASNSGPASQWQCRRRAAERQLAAGRAESAVAFSAG